MMLTVNKIRCYYSNTLRGRVNYLKLQLMGCDVHGQTGERETHNSMALLAVHAPVPTFHM